MTRGRHAKKQYSKMIILIFFIITMIIGIMWHLSPTEKSDQATNYKTIEGQIAGTGDQVVLLRQDNNQTYLLSLANTSMEGDDLLVGNHIKISYTGKLNKQYQDIQDVKVYKASISANQIRNGGKANTDKTIPIEYLSSLVENMSEEDKVDQLLIGYQCNQEIIDNHKLGGLVLSSEKLKDLPKTDIAKQIDNYQNNTNLSMFITLDDESILKEYVQDGVFDPISQVYNEKGMDGLKEQIDNKISIYKEVGMNLSFTPNGNDGQDDDSLNQDRNVANDYVSQVIQTIHKNDLGCCYRNYPSYGTKSDYSSELIHDGRSLEDLKNNEYQTIQTAINQGQDMILTTNQIIDALDNQNPISLSKSSLQNLRQSFHYNGLIMSDLTDEAIKNTDDYILKSIQAGNDMIISDDVETARQTIIDHIHANEISMNQIDLSVLRVLAYKYQLGIIS